MKNKEPMKKEAVPRPPRPKMDMAAVRRLLSYMSSYKLILFLIAFCIVLSSLAGVAGSLFIKTLIDDHIAPLLLQESPVFDGLARAVLTMGSIYLLGILSNFIYNRLMVKVSQGVLNRIRDEMFVHMQGLPIRYFDSHSHGDIMSHYTNDTDTLREMISQSLPVLCSSLITVVAVFVAMLATSVYMTLFLLVTITASILSAKYLGGKSGTYFVMQQKSIAKVNGFIEEMIHGQKVVKVFCHEERAQADFDKLNDELTGHSRQAAIFANILMPIMANLGTLQYVLLAFVGGILAINGIGGLTLGAIASFLQLSRQFTMPINQMAQQINAVVIALAGAQRIFQFLDEAPEQDTGKVTLVNITENKGVITETTERTDAYAWKYPHSDGRITYTPLAGDVRFHDVDFGYLPDKPVLHNVSLYAEPGQKLAFVGATGAGKTTITNLINRFYDIADGKIRYDGININKIRKDDLRRSLGVVLQDTNLFTDTVLENIRYGRLDATDEECRAAARLANAESFIEMLPNGYDTVISGDGADLSQGQRQLISIARAAVADPPVMILDEATSSIDTRTEAIVQKGMDRLMQGRTVFVIAHRLSTVKNSNVIMVLENGRVIERGSHQSLIAEKGKYYQLYTGAFELE